MITAKPRVLVCTRQICRVWKLRVYIYRLADRGHACCILYIWYTRIIHVCVCLNHFKIPLITIESHKLPARSQGYDPRFFRKKLPSDPRRPSTWWNRCHQHLTPSSTLWSHRWNKCTLVFYIFLGWKCWTWQHQLVLLLYFLGLYSINMMILYRVVHSAAPGRKVRNHRSGER